MFQFSQTERRILANQYRILKAVDLQQAHHDRVDEIIDILEHGYEGRYGFVLGSIADEPLSAEDCLLVEDVMVMVSTLLDSKGVTNIDLDEWEVPGFDANSESGHQSYAEFLFTHHKESYPGIRDVASMHRSMLPRYRAMVEAWKKSEHPANLTEADVARILTTPINHDDDDEETLPPTPIR